MKKHFIVESDFSSFSSIVPACKKGEILFECGDHYHALNDDIADTRKWPSGFIEGCPLLRKLDKAEVEYHTTKLTGDLLKAFDISPAIAEIFKDILKGISEKPDAKSQVKEQVEEKMRTAAPATSSVSDTAARPPLGVEPEWIFREKRVFELNRAMAARQFRNCAEWMEEFVNHVAWLNRHDMGKEGVEPLREKA